MPILRLPWPLRTALRRRLRRLARTLLEPLLDLAWRQPRLRQLGFERLLVRHLAPGTLCLVPFADHALLVDPRDDKIGARLLGGRSWQRADLERALWLLGRRGSLRPGGVFVDVGANIGALTVYALRSGVFARGLAIEPDAHNFAILSRNIVLNGLADRVQLVQAAVGATDGRVRLLHHARNLGGHRTAPLLDASGRVAAGAGIARRRLDDLLAEAGIAAWEVGLVKIDVEGDELAVLEGMPELRRASVPTLLEHVTSGLRPGSRDRVLDLLAADYASLGVIASDDGGATATGVSPPAELRLGRGEYDLLAFTGGAAGG